MKYYGLVDEKNKIILIDINNGNKINEFILNHLKQFHNLRVI